MRKSDTALTVTLHQEENLSAVKPVLSSRWKIDKTKVLKENGSLMKLQELQNAPHGAICNTFDLH